MQCRLKNPYPSSQPRKPKGLAACSSWMLMLFPEYQVWVRINLWSLNYENMVLFPNLKIFFFTLYSLGSLPSWGKSLFPTPHWFGLINYWLCFIRLLGIIHPHPNTHALNKYQNRSIYHEWVDTFCLIPATRHPSQIFILDYSFKQARLVNAVWQLLSVSQRHVKIKMYKANHTMRTSNQPIPENVPGSSKPLAFHL